MSSPLSVTCYRALDNADEANANPNKFIRAGNDTDDLETGVPVSKGPGFETKPTDGGMVCCKAIEWLGAIDRALSEKVQRSNSKLVESILFIPAHLFNRWVIVIAIAFTGVMGYFRYDKMLAYNNYVELGSEIPNSTKFCLGVSFAVFYGLCLLVMVISTQIMKYSFRRERPKKRTDTERWSDLRAKENGTYSMPSGDSSAAAVFCFVVACEMQLPWIYVLMPLVMLGRVFYQCHWLGDTVIGLLVGTFWGFLGVNQFNAIAWLLVLVSGENTFVKSVPPSVP